MTKRKELDIDEVLAECTSDPRISSDIYRNKCRALTAENERLRKENNKIWRAVDSFEQIIAEHRRRINGNTLSVNKSDGDK